MRPVMDSKILVVEDDPTMCESIRTLLDVHGFDVQTRATLSEAQDALQDIDYDLVLLDLKLKEQSGFALMDHLVDRCLDTRVIVVTGQHSEAYAITALKKGATDYLKKPVDPDELIASVNTVLDRQRHRRELELFKHAVDSASVAIAVGDSEGRIVYTNAAFRKLMHASEDVSRRLRQDSTGDDSPAPADEHIRKALSSRMSWRGKVDLVDAKGRPFSACKLVDPIAERIGGESWAVVLMCDMTAQLERELTVANSRERYRGVIDSQHEFLYRLNPDYLITFVNKAFAAYRKEPPRSMIGMPITAFVQESIQPRLLTALETVRSGSTPVEIEFAVSNEKGAICWQKWRIEGIRNANGDLIELQAVGRDVSGRKHAERQLQEESDGLKQALARVKRLSGMLPICASCKKIRDDSGYWNTIEEYIEKHSEAEFSHGICPDCARRLYPELYE